MHVIVVGCGRVGAELSTTLQELGDIVVVMDKRADAFRRLPPDFNGRTVHGSGFDRNDLEAAGVKDAHALAAVTAGDNTNIMSARIARETYQVANVVARIYDPRRAIIYQRLGIPTVATVTWTTQQVMRRLGRTIADSEWTDVTGEIAMVERPLPEQWVGRRLDDLNTGDRVRLSAVLRAGKTRIAEPGLIGQPDDSLYLLVASGALEELAATLEPGHANAGPRS